MNIGIFETLPGFGGGNVYQKYVIQVLSKRHEISRFTLSGHKLIGNRLGKIFHAAGVIRDHQEIDLWITTYIPTISFAFIGRPKNVISLFYHLDDDLYPNKVISFFLRNFFIRQARKSEKVVTIAKYWEEFLAGYGIPNPRTIYWGFDRALYDFSPDVAEKFRREYSFEHKPIVYLGNCQPLKGALESYEALKNMDAHFITSGNEEVKIPAINLNLSYGEYRQLLYTSNIAITMSRFKEGWNATAHEAMLAKTPVVGSGLGGMAELLEGGGQQICNNFQDLPNHVAIALSNSEIYSKCGYEFASQFTMERFKEDWMKLVDSAIL